MGRHFIAIAAICALTVHGLEADELNNPVVDPKARSLQIPCPGCAFPLSRASLENEFDDEEQLWTQQSEYEVNLSFSVSHNGKNLLLNNGPAVYPPEVTMDAYRHGYPLYIDQVSASRTVSPLEITSSRLLVESEEPVSDSGDAIVKLRFQILALEDSRVGAFPNIAIDLLKLSTGELFIVTINSLPDPRPLPTPAIPGLENDREQCGMLPTAVCELKKSLLRKIEDAQKSQFLSTVPYPSWHGWSKHLPTHIRPHFSFGDDWSGADSDHDRLYATTSHFDHHRYHRHHRYFHTIARGAIAILIPILAGITVGLFVSFLGLLVGRTVACIWINLVRGNQRGSASDSLERMVVEGEKMLVEDEVFDPLPVYEAAPAYEGVIRQPR